MEKRIKNKGVGIIDGGEEKYVLTVILMEVVGTKNGQSFAAVELSRLLSCLVDK